MIFHIQTLEYNKDILLLESELVNFENFKSGYNQGTWFDHAPNYFKGRVKDERCKEVYNVLDQIKSITGIENISPRFYKQEKNTEVPMHIDLGTKCCINIVLSDDFGPVRYEKSGNHLYTCAILDTTIRHCVLAYPEERIILKYSIFDYGYEYVSKKFLASSKEVSTKQTEKSNLSSSIGST